METYNFKLDPAVLEMSIEASSAEEAEREALSQIASSWDMQRED